ncbi:double-strand break repair protein AddB [Rhizobium sp. L1K21]|uniref:double-strand break repair protein AddB n=1 Tax=Rhizobium sp. L1K21 TaxID=2954933 RepID=UPI0020934C20|nr:double-strand break repair protein AddB [Rhizobium sp. L1K21]MCO6187983.1 double-strand break repair protein AddB [Rhizobium sp. L1K21]
MASGDKRIFTISPGQPFLRVLADSLMDGRLIPGFSFDPDNPQSLASATIYVPTRRAARVLRSEFTALCGKRSAILPSIRPLGETDEDIGYFEDGLPETLDMAEPIAATPALLELSQLILAWRNRLPAAITDLHDGQALIAPASPADAVWLAKGLLALIGEVETAELDWSALSNIDAGDHAVWWQLTLEFLKIASVYWPARLQELGFASPARHRNAVLMVEAERIKRHDHKGPVIVAGSTGSLPATARLIDAIASLEMGAVVLPGLDKTMPEDHWNMLHDTAVDGVPDPAIFSHPQFGLASLLKRMQCDRSDVENLGGSDETMTQRARVISTALAPSRATGNWPEQRRNVSDDVLSRSFADCAIIEAANEREEALAIATALRLALEKNGEFGESQVALITPDRTLARRVAGELSRFGIDADDSAGTPFYATPQGSLLRLVLEAALSPGDPVVLASLLKHPLALFGLDQKTARKAGELIEIHALRGGTRSCDISALPALLEESLSAQAAASFEPRWRPKPDEQKRALMQDYATRVSEAAEPLVSLLFSSDSRERLSTDVSTASWAQKTGEVLEAISVDENGDLSRLWDSEAGNELANLLAGVMQAETGLGVSGPEWSAIVQAISAGKTVKPRAMRHPRVFIFGTMEARLQHVDTVVLGGLNEGVWPGKTENSPFLSRSMKMAFGLEPPERRTGQIAHDFEMANGIRQVIYSRSMRQEGAPSVASRFLQRLEAVCGETITTAMRERGSLYLRYAHKLDENRRTAPAARPEPRPEIGLIPSRYSFSEVGRLRRDPYSVYAKRILRLDPVDPFNTDPGVADRGSLYHLIFDRFVRSGTDATSPDAWNIMAALIDEAFAGMRLPRHVEAVWRPRFEETARAFLKWELGRQDEVQQSFTEVRALLDLPDDIQISGIADRIDIKTSGLADIIDYKTGSSPSVKQARTLLDPQLSLEAGALQAGAFEKVGPREPENLVYVRLRPGDRFKVETVNNDGKKVRGDQETKSANDLAAESLREFTKLVTLLRSGERGFIARLIPESLGSYGDYDHLARVAEWSTAETSAGEDDDG